MYWAKVFDIWNAAGERKCTLLSKVVKSCLSLQNWNASLERSPSDNKNTLRPESNNLSDESLIGLRRMKEHAHKCTGAEHVNTLDKGIIKEMQLAHSNYINRKKEEEAEWLLSEARKKEELEKEEKWPVAVEQAEKTKSNIDKREKDLEKDEKNAEKQFLVAQRMYSYS